MKAVEWKSEKLRGSSQGPVTPRKDSSSILTVLHDFISYLRDERQASPLTLDSYERDLLRFINAVPEKNQLSEITPEDIRAHMQHLLGRKLSKATVRRAMHAMGSFLGWATRWRLIDANPSLQVLIPRRERLREVRALSKRERSVLIAAADKLVQTSTHKNDQQGPLLVRLMLKTGFRRSEVIGLSWGDINMEQGEILVRYGKGGKSRRVPLEDADLLTRLKQLRAQLHVDDIGNELLLTKSVFTGATGKRLTPSTFYKIFHRILAAAELKGTGITPHSLRHTFGSVLCQRGVPVPYVKDLLGHKDIGSTMIYVHSTPSELRNAVKKLRE